MELENFVFQYLKRGKNLESPEDIRLISYELQNLTKNIEADILKETLVNKISKELGVSKEALVATKKSTPKANTQTGEQPYQAKADKSFLLFIYIYSNFKDSITEKGALNFVTNSKEEALAPVKKVISSISNGSTEHTESALYTEAEMLNLKLSEHDALQEFQRISDEIQLKYDKYFLNEMKKMAKDKKLSVERKENLQKTLNLSDNISTQEEELIKFLNDYA
jgi:DNA primase